MNGSVPARCTRIRELRRRVGAALLRWIASGAAIDEARESRVREDELAALVRAIEAARRDGR